MFQHRCKVSKKVSKIFRLKELENRIGVKRSSIYKMMDEGLFPKPVRLGRRAVGWREEDIEHWLMQMQEISDE